MGKALTSDSRVAVVGGGPAGSFFALHLLRYAREQGRQPGVDIYEPRNFTLPGPRGCNHSAGILSAPLLRNMKGLGLELPQAVVQSRITTYVLHSPFGEVEIRNPRAGEELVSVYRGAGPRDFAPSGIGSFDQFLLETARAQGAGVIHQRVEALRGDPSPAVKVAGAWLEYDLVVLATGANGRPPEFEGLDYGPPPTRRMAQLELYADPEDIARAFGGRVRIFLLSGTDLVFGSLVPKGSFISVSLLGEDQPPSAEEFLGHGLVRAALAFPYRRACNCMPNISIGDARFPFADGFVAVGDAAATRLYKDGMGAALLTAREAARAAVLHGVGREDFRRHYHPLLQVLSRDNRYGRFLFRVHARARDSGALFRAHGHLVRQEWRQEEGRRPFNRVLWGLFTGSDAYGRILRLSTRPGFLARLAWRMGLERLRGDRVPRPVRIVVVGGGFAGLNTTVRLGKALRRDSSVSVTLVSRENFFLFTPLLHEVATGGIETRHIALPIRGLERGRNFNFLMGEVLSVDLENRQVTTDRGALPYDYLVLALGSIQDTPPLPEQPGNVLYLKSLYDGISLRNHIIRRFEEAVASSDRQPGALTFVVAGGGATGVQFIAEMRDFVRRFLLRSYPRLDVSKLRFVLVEEDDRLLRDMDPHLGAYALATLRRKEVDVMLGCRVTRITDQGVEINGAEELPTQTLIWSTGVRASPPVAALPVPKDERDRVFVSPYLEVPGHPGVYALGDNAHLAHPETGEPLPPRAHFAVRQPATVAHNILAEIKGGRKRPYGFGGMGQEMVSLGSRSAAARIGGLRLYGFPARVVWLAGYLALLTGKYNRVRVAMDWGLALIFGRDATFIRQR